MAKVQLYPPFLEQTLGYDQLRDWLSSYCLSEEGRERVKKMTMSDDAKLVNIWLSQTEEFTRILSSGSPFPDQHYHPIGRFIRKASVEGASLLEEEFVRIREFLKTISQIVRWFDLHGDQYPLLQNVAKGLTSQEGVIVAIDRRIDDKGQVKSSASQALSDILFSIQKEESTARKKIFQVQKKIQEQDWGPDTGISVRNDRLVVAIYAEHKKKVPGLVHDMSATGQTLFIEPTEVFESNNAIREWYLEKQQEIRRILTALTAEIAPHVEDLEETGKILGLLDFIRAKALLALAMNAFKPGIAQKPFIHWVKARHPILEKHLKSTQKSIIPLTIDMNQEQRILVISGPNAGGKSVVLKTLGLLQMMAQSGLLTPSSAGSETWVFKKIFADIGDQQNIENDLSTYSSHLANMKHFLTQGDSKSLLLMDEFGTGTDPQLGGPMAEAILEKLAGRFSFGAVSTHYTNLKRLASQVPGLFNGSMLFDQEALKPLYIYESGKPGSSYTFEIASRSGLDDKLIEKARSKAGGSHQKLEKLLSELEKEKVYIQQVKSDLLKTEERIKNREKAIQEKEFQWEEKRGNVLKKAKEEAAHLLKEANSKIENIIREIRETQAESTRTKLLRKELDTLKKEMEIPVQKVKKTPKNDKFDPGDTVLILNTGQTGEVSRVLKDGVEVVTGAVRSVFPFDMVEKSAGSEAHEKKRRMPSGVDINEKMAQFQGEINVIGKRAEEAIQEVYVFIDEALMLGHEKLRIIHGRGTGILKNRIRQELRKLPHIAALQDEDAQFGGDAITVVTLR